jgi:hypothetical protein
VRVPGSNRIKYVHFSSSLSSNLDILSQMSSGMASSRALHSPPGLEPVVPVKPVTSYNPIRHSERVGDSSTPHSLERSTDSDGQSKSPGSSLSPYPQDYPVPTQYLEDITNQVLPILFFSLFLIIGAVVLVYSLAEHQALPPHLATGLAITICVVLLLWVSLRIILYCAGRKRLGSFWSSPRQRCPLFVAERGDAHSMALEMKHGGGTKSKELFRPWCAYGSYFQPEQQARQGLSRPMMGQDKSLPLRKIRKEDWESISSENGGKGGAGRFYAKLRFPKDYNRSSTDWGNLPNILHQSKAIPIVSRDPGPARGDLSKGRYRLGNLTTSNKDHKTTHIIPSRKQVMVESDLPPPGRGLKARNSVDESLSTIPRQQGHLRVTNQGPIVPSPEPSPVLSTQVYSLSQPTPVHTRPCPSIGTFRQIKIPAPLLNMMDVQPSLFGRPGHLTHTKPPRADTPMPSPQFAPTETPRLLPQSNHSYLDTLVDFTGTKQSFIPTSDTMVDGTPEGAPPIHYLQIHSAPPEINKQLSSTKVFYEAFRRTSTSRASEVENRVFSAYSPPDTNLLLHAQKFIQKETAQYLPDTSQRESLDISERDTAFSDPDYEDLSAKEDNRISRMPGMKDPSPGYKRYANRPSAMEAVSPMEDGKVSSNKGFKEKNLMCIKHRRWET